MKKFVLLIIVLGFALSAYSQTKGFFTPADQIVKQRSMVKAGELSPWLLRPYFSLTAAAVQFGGGEPVVNALNSMGLGVSYGKFTTVNEKAYCTYSFNLSLLTQVNLNGITSPSMGAALSVDVFDKIVGVGIGYLDKHPMLLLNLSYSF